MFQDAVEEPGLGTEFPKNIQEGMEGGGQLRAGERLPSCAQRKVQVLSQDMGFPSSSATETCVTLASH